MDTITRTIYSFMSPRLRAIKRYDKDAELLQQLQLARVLRILNGTQYKRSFCKEDIKNYEEFRKKIPVTEYEPLRPWVDKMLTGQKGQLLRKGCSHFAVSSGTSGGRSKYLPVPGLHLSGCHYKGASDALWLYLASRPDSQFFKHKGLVIGGSHKPVNMGSGIRAGDLSAILVENMPSLGRMFRTPSKETLLMDEWTSKMTAIVNEVIKADVGSLSGVPSWMLEMIKAVMDRTKVGNLSELWPHLEVFFHGGISFDPYREKYKELIPSERMQYRETYNASEGFFAIQNDPLDKAMLLMLDYGIFYEFIPLSDFLEHGNESDQIIPLSQVVVGETYAMVISTLGGLYRYIIGDTIRFLSTHPYKIVIAGRTQHYINAFGEELMVHNANDALAQASSEFNCHVSEFSVAPYFLLDQAKGYHQWLVEFDTPPQDISKFTSRLDELLRQSNSDYDAKRYANMTLEPLRLEVARNGLFRQWLLKEGKLGGQHKVPRMKNDNTLMELLLELNNQEW